MARKILTKLTSTAGDSLVEVIVALLIAALGTAAIATMVVSSSSIISKNEAEMNALYAAELQVAGEANSQAATVTINGLGLPLEVPVTVYSDDNGEMARYEVSP